MRGKVKSTERRLSTNEIKSKQVILDTCYYLETERTDLRRCSITVSVAKECSSLMCLVGLGDSAVLLHCEQHDKQAKIFKSFNTGKSSQTI